MLKFTLVLCCCYGAFILMLEGCAICSATGMCLSSSVCIHTHPHAHTRVRTYTHGMHAPCSPASEIQRTHPLLQERGRVLRPALSNLQKLVTRGSLHPANIITRCNPSMQLRGPLLCRLNRCPYFTCRPAGAAQSKAGQIL